MNKNAFLAALLAKLAGLPQDDIGRSLEYYAECIDDAVEDGKSEEEAVAALGPVDEIANSIWSEVPMVKLAKHKFKRERRFRAWEVILLALGAPLWISLIAAAFAVVISVYASLWSVVVSLFAATAALGGSAFGGAVMAVYGLFTGQAAAALFLLGCALAAAGLCVLFFYLSILTAKGVIWLGKKIWLGLKKLVMKKEVRA